MSYPINKSYIKTNAVVNYNDYILKDSYAYKESDVKKINYIDNSLNKDHLISKRLDNRKKLIENNFKIKQVTAQYLVIEMERARQKKERQTMQEEDVIMRQFFRDFYISKVIVIQKFYKLRRLKSIFSKLITFFKEEQGIKTKKMSLFEKYDSLEPEVLNGLFKSPIYSVAIIKIQCIIRVKLAKNKRNILYKLKVQKSVIKIQSSYRRYIAFKRFLWLKNRSIKARNATRRFTLLYWFSKYAYNVFKLKPRNFYTKNYMADNCIYNVDKIYGGTEILKRAESADMTKYYYAGEDATKVEDEHRATSARVIRNNGRFTLYTPVASLLDHQEEEESVEESELASYDSDDDSEEAAVKKKKRRRKAHDDDNLSEYSAMFYDQLAEPEVIHQILELDSLIPMNMTVNNQKSLTYMRILLDEAQQEEKEVKKEVVEKKVRRKNDNHRDHFNNTNRKFLLNGDSTNSPGLYDGIDIVKRNTNMFKTTAQFRQSNNIPKIKLSTTVYDNFKQLYGGDLNLINSYNFEKKEHSKLYEKNNFETRNTMFSGNNDNIFPKIDSKYNRKMQKLNKIIETKKNTELEKYNTSKMSTNYNSKWHNSSINQTYRSNIVYSSIDTSYSNRINTKSNTPQHQMLPYANTPQHQQYNRIDFKFANGFSTPSHIQQLQQVKDEIKGGNTTRTEVSKNLYARNTLDKFKIQNKALFTQNNRYK